MSVDLVSVIFKLFSFPFREIGIMWILLKYMLLPLTMDWHSLLNIPTLGELVSLLYNLETCCVLFAAQIQDLLLYMNVYLLTFSLINRKKPDVF